MIRDVMRDERGMSTLSLVGLLVCVGDSDCPGSSPHPILHWRWGRLDASDGACGEGCHADPARGRRRMPDQPDADSPGDHDVSYEQRACACQP